MIITDHFHFNMVGSSNFSINVNYINTDKAIDLVNKMRRSDQSIDLDFNCLYRYSHCIELFGFSKDIPRKTKSNFYNRNILFMEPDRIIKLISIIDVK